MTKTIVYKIDFIKWKKKSKQTRNEVKSTTKYISIHTRKKQMISISTIKYNEKCWQNFSTSINRNFWKRFSQTKKFECWQRKTRWKQKTRQKMTWWWNRRLIENWRRWNRKNSDVKCSYSYKRWKSVNWVERRKKWSKEQLKNYSKNSKDFHKLVVKNWWSNTIVFDVTSYCNRWCNKIDDKILLSNCNVQWNCVKDYLTMLR